jgi:hypothetical protein
VPPNSGPDYLMPEVETPGVETLALATRGGNTCIGFDSVAAGPAFGRSCQQPVLPVQAVGIDRSVLEVQNRGRAVGVEPEDVVGLPAWTRSAR